MKIKIIDNDYERFNIDTSVEHEVLYTEIVDDYGMYYIIKDKNDEIFGIIDICVEEISE